MRIASSWTRRNQVRSETFARRRQERNQAATIRTTRMDIPLALSVRLVALRRSYSDCGDSFLFRITMSTTTANQAHTLPTVAQCLIPGRVWSSGGFLLPGGSGLVEEVRVDGTRMQDKEWEWTGKKGGKRASRHPIHKSSTTATHRTLCEGHSRAPQCASTQFGLMFPVVSQKRADHAEEICMTIS